MNYEHLKKIKQLIPAPDGLFALYKFTTTNGPCEELQRVVCLALCKSSIEGDVEEVIAVVLDNGQLKLTIDIDDEGVLDEPVALIWKLPTPTKTP